MGHRVSRWLADACAVIGFYRSAPGFPASVRGILENEPGNVVVPATAIWEVAIKTALGRLPDIRTGGHASLAGMLAAHGFDLVATSEPGDLAGRSAVTVLAYGTMVFVAEAAATETGIDAEVIGIEDHRIRRRFQRRAGAPRVTGVALALSLLASIGFYRLQSRIGGRRSRKVENKAHHFPNLLG